mmetsp:Transcript_9577/g.20207  ORF Transcript_9577/g.20207 Transcript_9577/m.20207 type:complete len:250 (+) Transcript_9577:307-1056(+)
MLFPSCCCWPEKEDANREDTLQLLAATSDASSDSGGNLRTTASGLLRNKDLACSWSTDRSSSASNVRKPLAGQMMVSSGNAACDTRRLGRRPPPVALAAGVVVVVSTVALRLPLPNAVSICCIPRPSSSSSNGVSSSHTRLRRCLQSSSNLRASSSCCSLATRCCFTRKHSKKVCSVLSWAKTGLSTLHRPLVMSIPKKRPGGSHLEREMSISLIRFWMEPSYSPPPPPIVVSLSDVEVDPSLNVEERR